MKTWKADLAKAKREGRALRLVEPISPMQPNTQVSRIILCATAADAVDQMVKAENHGWEAEILTDEGEANGEAK